MYYRWAALVLALCAMSPRSATAQSNGRPPRVKTHGVGKIGASYPNPFKQDTHILFTIGEQNCVPGQGRHLVSMRILNVLAQHVVTPQLDDVTIDTTSVVSATSGKPLHNVPLTCGSYSAYWNGKLAGGHHAAAHGVYAVQLLVDEVLVSTAKIYYAK